MMIDHLSPRIRIAGCGALATCVLLLGVMPLRAQDPPPTTDPPVEETTPPEDKKKQDAPPSLDDLLGLEEQAKDANADEAAQREIDEELQRELAEAQIRDAFRLAVEKMAISADLLDVRFDPGLGTQRVQEDIIAKLQQLIDQAKKQQQSSSSSSSSSSQQQSQPQDPGKQQKQEQQQAGQQRNPNPQDSGEGDPPPLQQGDLNTVIDELNQEWGNLPERIRNMMRQGRRGKYSSMYERMTSEYYKRLAEDDSR